MAVTSSSALPISLRSYIPPPPRSEAPPPASVASYRAKGSGAASAFAPRAPRAPRPATTVIQHAGAPNALLDGGVASFSSSSPRIHHQQTSVPCVNGFALAKLESRLCTQAECAHASANPETGPGKYNVAAAYERFIARRASCPRLSCGYRFGRLPDEAGKASPTASSPRGGLQSSQPTTSSPQRRPMSARVRHIPGRGHWLDGLASGSSFLGVYNRFLAAVPGVAAYDVAAASTTVLPHSPRATMGTAPRFPGDAKIASSAVAPSASSARPLSARVARPPPPATTTGLGRPPAATRPVSASVRPAASGVISVTGPTA